LYESERAPVTGPQSSVIGARRKAFFGNNRHALRRRFEAWTARVVA
jgi:hypothetical protein